MKKKYLIIIICAIGISIVVFRTSFNPMITYSKNDSINEYKLRDPDTSIAIKNILGASNSSSSRRRDEGGVQFSVNLLEARRAG